MVVQWVNKVVCGGCGYVVITIGGVGNVVLVSIVHAQCKDTLGSISEGATTSIGRAEVWESCHHNSLYY